MAAVRGQLDPKTLGSNRRAGVRRKLRLEAHGSTSSERTDVMILDVSTTGVLLETTGDLSAGETIELELPGETGITAVVKWSSGQLYGCQFGAPVSDAVVSAALLRAPHYPSISQLDSQFTSAHAEDAPDAVEKLPRAVRMQLLLGTTLLFWTVVAAAVFFALQ